MRVLFFNEGNLGSHIMGQGQLDAALRAGMEGSHLDARFSGLTPMGRWTSAAASRRLQPLARQDLDFPTLRWHLVQSLRARRALRLELDRRPADVVHVHSQSIVMTMSARTYAVPVVVSLDATVQDWWGMPAWRPTARLAPTAIAPSHALERRALSGAALILAWSAWARRSVERSVPKARVVEHHPGIDLARYRPAERRERERPRVLFVGGRFAEKGGEDLLGALDDEIGNHLDIDLVTPAAVPERPGLRVHRLDPSDPRLLDLQQQADVMCLPTYADANPWALLEALACGTPVIASPVGGIPDMLDHGRAGMLVPHGDRLALREAVLGLLSDPSRSAALGGAARRHCEAHYDAKRQFGRLEELLREISPKDGRPA